MNRAPSGQPPMWRIVVVCLACLHAELAPAWADARQPIESAPAAVSPVQFETTPSATDEPTALSMFLGRLHHLVIHFPIALLAAAMIIELIAAARRKALPTDAGLACLLIGALGAGAAAWFGWIHAAVEGSDSGMLDTHRWLGIATAVVAGLTLATAILARCSSWVVAPRLYLLGVLVSAVVVAATGHFGAAMIYGPAYFVEVFMDEQPPDPTTIPTPPQAGPGITTRSISYDRDIRPIFETSCIRCHGPQRQRAKLRLDIPTGVFGRDAADWVIRPGDPDQSELVRRLELPASDEDHMPYMKSPLPRVQIERIRLWILEGAVWGDFQPVPAPALRDPIPAIEIDPGGRTAEEQPEVAAAQSQRIPDCCAEAGTTGGSCDHDCCIESASRGEVCRKCLGEGG